MQTQWRMARSIGRVARQARPRAIEGSARRTAIARHRGAADRRAGSEASHVAPPGERCGAARPLPGERRGAGNVRARPRDSLRLGRSPKLRLRRPVGRIRPTSATMAA